MAKDIESYLDKLYSQWNLQLQSNNFETSLIFLIIQIKQEYHLLDYKQDMYCDVKQFILNYISHIQNKKEFGYDVIDLSKITLIISGCSPTQQYRLYEYACSMFKINHMEDQAKSLELFLKKAKIKIIKSDNANPLVRYFKLFLHLTSYDLRTVIICLSVVFVFMYIITTDAPNGWPILFKINSVQYSPNLYLNHFLNLLTYLSGISKEEFIVPISSYGVILLLSIKLFYILYIANYLFRIIIEKIKPRN